MNEEQYEMAWNDMKRWLQVGIEYLENRGTEISMVTDRPYFQLEAKRIEGKLEALKLVQEQIRVSENIHRGEEV